MRISGDYWSLFLEVIGENKIVNFNKIDYKEAKAPIAPIVPNSRDRASITFQKRVKEVSTDEDDVKTTKTFKT